MNKVKELNFEGETISIGLDMHKSNWKVNGRMNQMEIAVYSQDPDPMRLKKYFDSHYPGAKLQVAYEAGFCGFSTQRALSRLGIDCIVVNAADIPAANKDLRRKDDKRDARKISLALAKGELKPIYVPGEEIENARALVRHRCRMIQAQTRIKNQVKHFLMYHNLSTAVGDERWSLKFIKRLQQLNCGSVVLNLTLKHALDYYMSIRHIIKELTVAIRNLSREEPFAEVQKILQSIDGIGLLNGMVIQTEIGDIKRFKRLDSLCDYAGFVPDMYSTNDKMKHCRITKRANEYLRAAIIEASWTLIRKDPAMLMKYKEYCRRMNSNKAIIRISKHLLSRIKYLWTNGKTYERGVIE